MNISSEKLNKIRAELLPYFLRMYNCGMQKSDGGNISMRVKADSQEYILIKASGCCFADMKQTDLVLTDMQGQLLEGGKAPSKEVNLHSMIYRVMPDVSAVVHCHSPWATGFAHNSDKLDFSTYHSEIKLSGYVPVFDTKGYIVDKENIDGIEAVLRSRPELKAFLLRGHGQVALGKNIYAAVNIAELIEETAQIATISKII